ncbi:DUF4255 domain-containing protein [Paludibacterium purpuratum]|uniref:Uncharacterized protein DUF4255 n=1 Tax=Paludibacterium purpuratum TaxID=1144873 RepID=A0A4R7BGC0_9NEIS|nr:DUF4255 domain-containing protein [Paludibacterium purpuratum]TDR82766.1 uncharacterized protein DUF4255 [Paludibacterium purpuratum]
MIDSVLDHLAMQLNQHFRRRAVLGEDMVVVSNLHEPGGGAVLLAENKLVLFIGGIERETAAHRARSDGIGLLRGAEPLYLNLLVMCAATFSGQGYPEALKFLSDAIAFFQSRPVFDHQNSPDLDPRIERLVLNIENLSRSEMHSMWSIHGGRYLPSVLYRVRLVCLDGDMPSRRETPVRAPDVALERK